MCKNANRKSPMFSPLKKMVENLTGVGLHSAVSSVSDYRSRGRKFKSQLGHITFVEIMKSFLR